MCFSFVVYPPPLVLGTADCDCTIPFSHTSLLSDRGFGVRPDKLQMAVRSLWADCRLRCLQTKGLLSVNPETLYFRCGYYPPTNAPRSPVWRSVSIPDKLCPTAIPMAQIAYKTLTGIAVVSIKLLSPKVVLPSPISELPSPVLLLPPH